MKSFTGKTFGTAEGLHKYHRTLCLCALTQATQLEAELLRARQELVECQLQTELQRAPPLSSLPSHLTSGSSSSHGDGGSGIIESSQSDSEWQSSGYSSSYQENSQCPDGEESTSIKDRDGNTLYAVRVM